MVEVLIMNVEIIKIIKEELEEDYIPVIITTKRGEIHCRYYESTGAKAGAIWVGGVGGGFDTPANGLYPELSVKLKEEQISSLRIQFRYSKKLDECVHDCLAGIEFLQKEKINNIALIGHSLGGSVVIQAAAISKSVKTVVALATQSYGADSVKDFPENTSILLIHGKDDSILPSSCTRTVFGLAHDPKERIILNGNGHNLNESSDQVKKIVFNWLKNNLSI